MKVDVIMLTFNSASRSYVFKKCLRSIKNNIPIRNFIVVDKFSQDNTIEVISSYFSHVKIIQTNAKRGKAREIGIKNCGTEFIVFVDDDVILCKNWFKKAIGYFKKNKRIGAVVGALTPAYGTCGWPHIYLQSKLRGVPMQEIVRRYVLARRGGDTSNLILRKKCVKNIKIPNELFIYEDVWIKEWVEAKKYKFLIVTDPYAIHFRQGVPEAGPSTIKILLKYGYPLGVNLRNYLLWNFITSFSQSLLILLLFKNFKLAKDNFYSHYYNLVSYFFLKNRI
jgi:glycosyltransferase involved in cell wall biosynthesis